MSELRHLTSKQPSRLFESFVSPETCDVSTAVSMHISMKVMLDPCCF